MCGVVSVTNALLASCPVTAEGAHRYPSKARASSLNTSTAKRSAVSFVRQRHQYLRFGQTSGSAVGRIIIYGFTPAPDHIQFNTTRLANFAALKINASSQHGSEKAGLAQGHSPAPWGSDA
jgi:hypothetical protein